jgi:chromate transporter
MFSFGGAYGAIPLIRDIVLSHGWLQEEMFTYFVAVSESTPGPIMVNMATYVGSSQAGFLGAVLATVGVVLPSFIIILLIVAVLKNFIKNKYVQAVLKGIRPCFIGIVLAMGLYMIISNIYSEVQEMNIAWQSILISGVLLVLPFVYQRIIKKEFPPIMLIIFSAVLGMVVYA